jgi:NAD(P)-dependent dehydrogenase (short-subunit alcohol dehydrogenase family)
MHFEGKKVIVVGGIAGMGRQVAIDIVDHGGSAVIVGLSKNRVDDAVAELSRRGHAWGIAAELTDRVMVADVQRALSEQHSNATLLVNSAGFFIPKPFLAYEAHDYDSYMELNHALFFASGLARSPARAAGTRISTSPQPAPATWGSRRSHCPTSTSRLKSLPSSDPVASRARHPVAQRRPDALA